MAFRFPDRHAAGRALAERLMPYAGRDDVVVLALPRGGVPVGFEVAMALHVPLDVFIVRKLGVPGQEELAMGAIATGGVRVLNEPLIDQLGIPRPMIDRVTAIEEQELERRERAYRDGRPPLDVRDRVVLLVDDGLATGASMFAAIAALRQRGPARVVVGVPVAPRDTCRALERATGDAVCVATPDPFYGVGYWYDDFSQTTDEEVHALLTTAAGATAKA